MKIEGYEAKQVRAWIKAHHGILTEIAVRCTVTPQHVQKIAYGRLWSPSPGDKGWQVEQELRREGWPGITRRRS